MTPVEFRGDLWRQKTRVTGLPCGVVCVILRLAVLVELRLVTDRHRHRPIASTADAYHRAVKTDEPIEKPFGLWAPMWTEPCIRWAPVRISPTGRYTFGGHTSVCTDSPTVDILNLIR